MYGKPFVAPEEAEVPPVMSLSSKVASWVMKAPRGKKNVWTIKGHIAGSAFRLFVIVCFLIRV